MSSSLRLQGIGVANRDTGTIQKIDGDRLTIKLDGPVAKAVSFDASSIRHFDHGYAMTSHSSQGITAERVLVNMDTKAPSDLLNPRFAYVALSRASLDTQVYTNDAASLPRRLSIEITKSSATLSEGLKLPDQRNSSSKQKHGEHIPMFQDAPTSTLGIPPEGIDGPKKYPHLDALDTNSTRMRVLLL